MKDVKINIFVDSAKFESDPSACVLYSITDAEGKSLLEQYTTEEISTLGDNVVEGIMLGLDCIRALFNATADKRNIYRATNQTLLSALVPPDLRKDLSPPSTKIVVKTKNNSLSRFDIALGSERHE